MDKNRRNLVIAIATIFSLPIELQAASLSSSKKLNKESSINELSVVIKQCCPNIHEAFSLGALYLKKYPEESSIKALKSKIVLQYEGQSKSHSHTFAQLILEGHNADCQSVNMVTINGLILSETEARLYALGFLLS